MQKQVIVPAAIIAALAIGGGSFYAGMQYQKSQRPASATLARGAGGQRAGSGMGANGSGMPRGGAGGGFTAGEVVSKDANSLTLKLRDGGSKIIFFSSSTAIGKMSTGSVEDLTTGKEVTIMGTTNSDGSITASTIQLRPEGMIGNAPRGPRPTEGGQNN